MAKTCSSKRWLHEHFNDPFVKKARQDSWRSRASYKLLEIHKKHTLFRKGIAVADLGAAPGGWSQVADMLVGETGKVIASDILPITPINRVEFVQGDFTEAYVFDTILEKLNSQKLDLVISDMAPNISGIKLVDQAKSFYLAELALDFGCRTLCKDGGLLVKVFHGQEFERYIQQVQVNFAKMKICKPQASRSRSKEIYVLAQGFKGS